MGLRYDRLSARLPARCGSVHALLRERLWQNRIWAGGARMTRQDFRRDGFAVFQGLLAQPELDVVADDIRGVFARRARAMGLDVPAGNDHDTMSQLLLSLFAADRPSYLATARQTQYLASVHQLGLSPPI